MKKLLSMQFLLIAFASQFTLLAQVSSPYNAQPNQKNQHFVYNNVSSNTGLGSKGGTIWVDHSVNTDTVKSKSGVLSLVGTQVRVNGQQVGITPTLQQVISAGNTANGEFSINYRNASLTNVNLLGSAPFSGIRRNYLGFTGLVGVINTSAFTADSARAWVGYTNFASQLHGLDVGIRDSSTRLNSFKELDLSALRSVSFNTPNIYTTVNENMIFEVDGGPNYNYGVSAFGNRSNLTNKKLTTLYSIYKPYQIDNNVYGIDSSSWWIDHLYNISGPSTFSKHQIKGNDNGIQFNMGVGSELVLNGLPNQSSTSAITLVRNPSNNNRLEWADPASLGNTNNYSTSSTIPLNSSGYYTSDGTTASSTLPSLSSSVGRRYIFINTGTGNWIITTSGLSNDIYDVTMPTNTLTIAPGESYIVYNTSTNWFILN